MIEIATWVGTVATVVASVSIIWKKAVKPVISWGIRLDKTMSFVEQQMVPNGGTSLRDSVNRIEYRLSALEDHITNPK